MMKKVLSAAMVAALALSVAACGGGDKKDAPKDGAKPAATAAPAKVDRSKEFITVLTGPTSGIYFPIGGAFSKVVGEMGYKTSATATGATGENINAILTGKGELAIAMSDSVIQAVEGFGAYEGKPKATDLRAMMGLWPNVVQIVTTTDSGIKSLRISKARESAWALPTPA